MKEWDLLLLPRSIKISGTFLREPKDRTGMRTRAVSNLEPVCRIPTSEIPLQIISHLQNLPALIPRSKATETSTQSRRSTKPSIRLMPKMNLDYLTLEPSHLPRFRVQRRQKCRPKAKTFEILITLELGIHKIVTSTEGEMRSATDLHAVRPLMSGLGTCHRRQSRASRSRLKF